MKRILSAATLGSALILAAAQPAGAQASTMPGAMPAAAPAVSLEEVFRGTPGASMGAPWAYGLGMGDAFVSMNYQQKRRAVQAANGTWGPQLSDDASLSLGLGLGDAHEMLGLTLVATAPSPFRYGAKQGISLSAAVSHYFDPTMAFAVGVENAMQSGGRTEGADSYYLAGTKVWDNPTQGIKQLIVDAGVGNGRYRFYQTIRDGEDKPGVFGSVGLKLHEQFTVSGEWSGQDLNFIGVVKPLKDCPLILTPGIYDVTQTANRVARFVLGAGMAYHF